MKTKTILLTLAGLGLTTALMANGPQGGWDGSRGERGQHGMHQQGDHPKGMQRGGNRDGKKMRRGDRRAHNKGFMRQLGRQLDLTKEQRQKIRAVFQEERQAKKAERKALRTHRGQGKKRAGMFGQMNPETFMSADHFDKEAFTKAAQDQAAKRKAERQAKRTSRLKQRAAFVEKIFNILTPEQRVKWIELSKGK